MKLKNIALAFAAFSSATAFPASAQSDLIVVDGTCSDTSGVQIDDNAHSQFDCNAVVIGRVTNGNILIQFIDKTGDDGRILGFSGAIEGKQGYGAEPTQMVAVQRVYLGGGVQPISANRGVCILNWSGLHRTGGRLTSAMCSGAGVTDSLGVKAIAILEVK